MSRLEMPSADTLSELQAEVCAEAASGPRAKVPAPTIAWIQSPELARHAQRLGEFLRFGTTLSPRLTELAILVCARHWTSHHEWTAHKKLALAAGLDEQSIADIAARKRPDLSEAADAVVYDIACSLLASGRLPDTLYDQGMRILGRQGLVELVGTLGYYCLVSLTLNAFELGLPESMADELADPEPGLRTS